MPGKIIKYGEVYTLVIITINAIFFMHFNNNI